MSDRTPKGPSPELIAAQRLLEEARVSSAADEPVLSQASTVASDLRNERMVNGWDARVRAAFQGAA